MLLKFVATVIAHGGTTDSRSYGAPTKGGLTIIAEQEHINHETKSFEVTLRTKISISFPLARSLSLIARINARRLLARIKDNLVRQGPTIFKQETIR
jgi:hypothetical protein